MHGKNKWLKFHGANYFGSKTSILIQLKIHEKKNKWKFDFFWNFLAHNYFGRKTSFILEYKIYGKKIYNYYEMQIFTLKKIGVKFYGDISQTYVTILRV